MLETDRGWTEEDSQSVLEQQAQLIQEEGNCNENEKVYPSIRQAIWLLVLIFLLVLVLSVPVAVLGEVLRAPLGSHPLVLGVTNLVSFGLILWLGLRKTRAPFQQVFSTAPISVSLLLPITLTVLGLATLLSEVDNLFRMIVPMSPGTADFFTEIIGGKRSLWGSVILAIVVAPATEELLFRGLILRGFLSRYSVRKAILISAVLFGLFHLNPWQFLPATIAGVLLAWLFVKTGSLLPCFFAHAVQNAVPVLLLGVFDLEVQGLSTRLTEVEFQPLWLDAAALLIGGLGFWLLIRRFREAKEAEVLKVPPRG